MAEEEVVLFDFLDSLPEVIGNGGYDHLPVELLGVQLFLYLLAAERDVECAVLAVFEPGLISDEVFGRHLPMVLAKFAIVDEGSALIHFIINF